MKNTICVTTTFSFKGETYSPSAVVDLDKYAADKDSTHEGLIFILAQLNNIDTYSYLFEVMQQTELDFTEPTGLAVNCLGDDGQLDLVKFRELKLADEIQQQLNDIAKTVLGINELDKESAIRKAMLKAYEMGKNNRLS